LTLTPILLTPILTDAGFASWIAFASSLGIGLLIGIERERNPAAKAGVRTFALVALLGTLASFLSVRLGTPWLLPVGLAAVVGMLVVAYAQAGPEDEPGTTTVAAAGVCYLLGALVGTGETALAAALAIGVTALLYFKPELEGVSSALTRQDQVSILQFLVVSFIVLPVLPDRGYGPYGVLNPYNIWLMVVLIAGVGLISYLALRFVGERHGVLLTGVLGGLVSSTATTVLYARRSQGSTELGRVALVVVLLANLVPLLRVGVVASVVAPSVLPELLPMLGGALAVGGIGAALSFRRLHQHGGLPMPDAHNPTEIRTAMQFGAIYAVVLLLSAWLSDLAGARGLYLAAFASGFMDVDPALLSALNLYRTGSVAVHAAALAIGLAVLSNMCFKLGVLYAIGGTKLGLRATLPMAAAAVGGALGLLLAG
jgi:uncharacterized membrane protein (DUF4010 family)